MDGTMNITLRADKMFRSNEENGEIVITKPFTVKFLYSGLSFGWI